MEWETYFNKVWQFKLHILTIIFQACFFLSMKYVEAGLEAIQQALLALERDTQMAKKKYNASDVLK